MPEWTSRWSPGAPLAYSQQLSILDRRMGDHWSAIMAPYGENHHQFSPQPIRR